jgi:dynein heavy chain
VEAKIVVLEADLKAAIEKKDALSKQAADCEKKLANAEKLIGGLGGERTRWIANIGSLEIDIKNVVGDVCIAAGAIAYTGPFTPAYRTAFNKDWLRIVAESKVLSLAVRPFTNFHLYLKDVCCLY